MESIGSEWHNPWVSLAVPVSAPVCTLTHDLADFPVKTSSGSSNMVICLCSVQVQSMINENQSGNTKQRLRYVYKCVEKSL